MMLDEEELKAKQVQEDKRRMSQTSFPGRPRRASRISSRVAENEEGGLDEDLEGRKRKIRII